MIFIKKTTGYVSEVDQFLAKFDSTHDLTESQIAEIKKHQRVQNLRDEPQAAKSDKEKIWEEF